MRSRLINSQLLILFHLNVDYKYTERAGRPRPYNLIYMFFLTPNS